MMPSIDPSAIPTLSPSVSPTRSPTSQCNALLVAIVDDPFGGAFDGLYTLNSNKWSYGRGWWEIPQNADRRNIYYSGTAWTMRSDDALLSHTSNAYYPSDVGADAEWTHSDESGAFRAVIRCIASAAPSMSPKQMPTPKACFNEQTDYRYNASADLAGVVDAILSEN